MKAQSMILAVSLAAALTFASSGAAAAGASSELAAAVADGSRPQSDKERDANRKPLESLQFAGVKRGDKIAEFLPGGGYFTRIFSKAVGSHGHVYVLVPKRPPNAPDAMPDFAAKIAPVAEDPNYSNVSVVVDPWGKLAPPIPVDLVWTSQNYHDLHNVSSLDMAAFNQAVFDALKPGGIYIVLDHAAAAGSGVRDTATLHRIDPQTVKNEATAAGFVFVAGSDLLYESADDHSVKVFDPAIRGKTDQFILKFRKPGNK